MEVKISIVVPVYEISLYIRKCIDSILNQSFQDIQIIIVNDGSPDNCEEIILNEYKDDRILYLKKKNGGLSDARNYAIPYLNGKYTLFVDGDDYLEDDALLKMYEIAENTNPDILEFSYFQDFGDHKVLKNVCNGSLKSNLAFGCCAVWNKLYKTSLIKETNIKFLKGVLYEDINFNTKLYPFINKREVIDIPLYNYVQRNNSICHIYNSKLYDIYKSFDDIYAFYKEEGFYDDYKKEIEYLFMRHIFGGVLIRGRKMNRCPERKQLLKFNRKYFINLFPKYRVNRYYMFTLSKYNCWLHLISNKIVYSIFCFL